jgi:hypothetical protein
VIRKIITCSVLLPVLTAIILSIAMGKNHFWMKQRSLPVFWNGSPGGRGGGKACVCPPDCNNMDVSSCLWP